MRWNPSRGANGWRLDPHWCPQAMTLRAAQRWRAVDVVGHPRQVEDGSVVGQHCGLLLTGGTDAHELHGAST